MAPDAHSAYDMPPLPSRAWDDGGLGHALWQRHALAGLLSERIARPPAPLDARLRARAAFLARLLSRGRIGRQVISRVSELPLVSFFAPARRFSPGLKSGSYTNLALQPSSQLDRSAHHQAVPDVDTDAGLRPSWQLNRSAHSYSVSSRSSASPSVNPRLIQRAFSETTGHVVQERGANTTAGSPAPDRAAPLEPELVRGISFRYQSNSPGLQEALQLPHDGDRVATSSAEINLLSPLATGTASIEQRVSQALHHSPEPAGRHSLALSQTAKLQAAIHEGVSQNSLFRNGNLSSAGVWSRAQQSLGLLQLRETPFREPLARLHAPLAERLYGPFRTSLLQARFFSSGSPSKAISRKDYPLELRPSTRGELIGYTLFQKPPKTFHKITRFPEVLKALPVQGTRVDRGYSAGIYSRFERIQGSSTAGSALSERVLPPAQRVGASDFIILRKAAIGRVTEDSLITPLQPDLAGIPQYGRAPFLSTVTGDNPSAPLRLDLTEISQHGRALFLSTVRNLVPSHRQLALSGIGSRQTSNVGSVGVRQLRAILTQPSVLVAKSATPAVIQGFEAGPMVKGIHPPMREASLVLRHSLSGVGQRDQGIDGSISLSSATNEVRNAGQGRFQAPALVQGSPLAARPAASAVAGVLPDVAQDLGKQPLAVVGGIYPHRFLRRKGLVLRRSLGSVGQVERGDSNSVSPSLVAHEIENVGGERRVSVSVHRGALAAKSTTPVIAGKVFLPTVTRIARSPRAQPLAMAGEIRPRNMRWESLALKRPLDVIGRAAQGDNGDVFSIANEVGGVRFSSVDDAAGEAKAGRREAPGSAFDVGFIAARRSLTGSIVPGWPTKVNHTQVGGTESERFRVLTPIQHSTLASTSAALTGEVALSTVALGGTFLEKDLLQRRLSDSVPPQPAEGFASVPAATLLQRQIHRLSHDRLVPLVKSGSRELPAIGRSPALEDRRASGLVMSLAVQPVRTTHAISVQTAEMAQQPRLISPQPSLPLAQSYQRRDGEDYRMSSGWSGELSLPLAPPAVTESRAAFPANQPLSRISMQTSPGPVANPGLGLPSAAPAQTVQAPAIATPGEGSSPTQPDLDGLVEKVWRRLMRKLAVERERRGRTTWP